MDTDRWQSIQRCFVYFVSVPFAKKSNTLLTVIIDIFSIWYANPHEADGRLQTELVLDLLTKILVVVRDRIPFGNLVELSRVEILLSQPPLMLFDERIELGKGDYDRDIANVDGLEEFLFDFVCETFLGATDAIPARIARSMMDDPMTSMHETYQIQ